MDDGVRNLRRIGHFKEIAIFPSNLTLAGREFHRVGAATEKAFVFTR